MTEETTDSSTTKETKIEINISPNGSHEVVKSDEPKKECEPAKVEPKESPKKDNKPQDKPV